jgi:hypothetical protein
MPDKIHFIAIVDLPLALATVLAFILHFNAWARVNNTDTSVDLSTRLPAARIRVVCLFAVIVGLCWTADLAVWAVFAFLLAIGAVIALLTASQGGEFLLVIAAYLIREWAFGFPQLVLHPPRQSRGAICSTPPGDDSPLIGRSGLVAAPLRPCGKIECDGAVWPAKADDGRYVDPGTKVVVTGLQNGTFVVRVTNTEQPPDHDAVNRSGQAHVS